MSFQDRPYYQQPSDGGFNRQKLTIGMPPLTPMVKILLIINVVVFVLQNISPAVTEMFAVQSQYYWQIWRLITFQFLHGSVIHIVFNMLGLYFLGTALERSWGGKKLLKFYLICGAVGGLLYALLSGLFNLFGHGILVGASGGVLGIMVACAILFPHFKLIFLIFPVPIRFAATLITVIYALNVLNQGPNAGGDICHLGGMATGFIMIMGRGYFDRIFSKAQKFNVEKTFQEKQAFNAEVDRILDKVNQYGMTSLTDKEKKTLIKASEEQRNGKF